MANESNGQGGDIGDALGALSDGLDYARVVDKVVNSDAGNAANPLYWVGTAVSDKLENTGNQVAVGLEATGTALGGGFELVGNAIGGALAFLGGGFLKK